jgi:hypothetical protein
MSLILDSYTHLAELRWSFTLTCASEMIWLVTIELTIKAVTTPMKQARAKKRRANCVFVVTFMAYKLSEIIGKVNKKIFLAIRIFFC